MKVLCVCIGNNDRSPVMAAVIGMYLKNAGHNNVTVESAGIGENAADGKPIRIFGIKAAARLGLDISKHEKRRTTSLKLEEYDLIITADDNIAGELVKQG